MQSDEALPAAGTDGAGGAGVSVGGGSGGGVSGGGDSGGGRGSIYHPRRHRHTFTSRALVSQAK